MPLVLALGACASAAQPQCASNVEELRRLMADPRFALRWSETTMHDGKPLVVTLRNARDALWLQFDKTGEGLWAEGPAQVCREGDHLAARIEHQSLQLGPAANWLLRQAMRSGARFRLSMPSAGRLEIATAGWSGAFVPSE